MEKKLILLKENTKLKELQHGCGQKEHKGAHTQFECQTTCESPFFCGYCKKDIAKQKGRIEGIKFIFRKLKSTSSD